MFICVYDVLYVVRVCVVRIALMGELQLQEAPMSEESNSSAQSAPIWACPFCQVCHCSGEREREREREGECVCV